jgi:5-deoxy-glucuronate isomerase
LLERGGPEHVASPPSFSGVTLDGSDTAEAARSLLHRAASGAPDGLVSAIDPATAGWEYLAVSTYVLQPGQSVRRAANDQERLVLQLEGRGRVTVGERDLGSIGSRSSVFDGPPAPVVLVAPEESVELVAETAALVVVAAAPGGPIRVTRRIDADEIRVETRGSGNTTRTVHHLLGPSTEAGRLIAFEVFTPGGNWSSYPPHKHDTEDPPVEARLEEYYFYRFADPRGFAVQRVYTPDRSLDETLTATDGDVVLVPRGYHPVGVAAGYDCYYLNIMAGPNRAWHFTLDPDHSWLMNWSPPGSEPQRAPPSPGSGS